MAQEEAPRGSSADLCTQTSLCSGGTSLSASACRSAVEPPRTCARSAPACCGLSHLEHGNPNWPEDHKQTEVVKQENGAMLQYIYELHWEEIQQNMTNPQKDRKGLCKIIFTSKRGSCYCERWSHLNCKNLSLFQKLRSNHIRLNILLTRKLEILNFCLNKEI